MVVQRPEQIEITAVDVVRGQKALIFPEREFQQETNCTRGDGQQQAAPNQARLRRRAEPLALRINDHLVVPGRFRSSPLSFGESCGEGLSTAAVSGTCRRRPLAPALFQREREKSKK